MHQYRRFTVGTDTTGANRRVAFTSDTGQFFLTAGDRDAFDPRVVDDFIYWGEDDGSTIDLVHFPLRIRTPLDPTTYTKIWPQIDIGQSLRTGVLSRPLFDATAAATRRAIMPNIGPRLVGAGSADQVTTAVDIKDIEVWQDLREIIQYAAGETGASEQIRTIIDEGSGIADLSFAVANVSINAAEYDEIKKGTVPWNNATRAMAALNLYCWANNVQMMPPVFYWEQGRAYVGPTQSEVEADLEEVIDDLQDIWDMARTWQTQVQGSDPGLAPVAICQIGKDPVVALAQAAVVHANTSKVDFWCHEYLLETSNDAFDADPTKGVQETPNATHLSPAAQMLKGAFEAQARLEWLTSGFSRQSLRATSASRAGSTVTVSFNTSAPNITTPLQFEDSGDLGGIVDSVVDGNFGITYKDDGGQVSITSTPSIVGGGTQVEFDINTGELTSGTEYVQIGLNPSESDEQGPHEGMRTELCDSDTTTRTIDSVLYNLRHYCDVMEIAIT